MNCLLNNSPLRRVPFLLLLFFIVTKFSSAQIGVLEGQEIFEHGKLDVSNDLYLFDQGEYTDLMVTNKVKLNLVDFDFPNSDEAFTVEVPFTITFFDQNGNQSGGYEFGKVKVEWQGATLGYSATDESIYIANGSGYRMKVQVDKTNLDENLINSMGNNIVLQAEVDVERIYHLAEDVDLQPEASINTATEEIEFNWLPLPGAHSYELSYFFLPEGWLSYAEITKQIAQAELLILESKNATKIVTNSNNFNISAAFEEGDIYFSVRAIGKNPLNSAYNFFTNHNWIETNSLTIGEYDSFESNKTWSYNAVYSSESRKGESITYVDATGRVRQQVTKDWEHGNALVGEQFYGFLGEPMISVAPGVVPSKKMSFYEEFTVNASGNVFNKENYATDAKLNNPDPIFPMANSGNNEFHNNYFSENNPFLGDGVHDYIADAEGYNYQQTVFNAQGKVSKVSGIGPDHKMGSGHEVEIFYATPSQDELDKLFGNEVGDATHYSYAVTKNQDGQQSISYYNLAGQVIATALVGKPGDNLTEIQSTNYVLCGDNYEDLTETVGLNSFQEGDNNIHSVNNIGIKKEGVSNFKYEFDPLSFETCLGDNNCSYIVTIYVKDDFSNLKEILFEGSEYEKLVFNVSPGDESPETVDAIDVDFDVYLEEGAYTIHKIIKRNDEDLFEAQIAYEEAIRNGECTTDQSGNDILSFEEILNNILSQYPIDCDNDPCDVYSRELGSYCASIWISTGTNISLDDVILNPLGYTPIEFGGTYDFSAANIELIPVDDQRVSDYLNTVYSDGSNAPETDDDVTRLNYLIDGVCSSEVSDFIVSDCAESRATLLEDVSPGGQYFESNSTAFTDPQWWFNTLVPSVDQLTFYRYTDLETGTLNTTEPIEFSSWQEVRDNWNPGFAETLIEYHPEYCMITWCEDIKIYENYQFELLSLNLRNGSELSDAYTFQITDDAVTVQQVANDMVFSNDPLNGQSIDIDGASYRPLELTNMNAGTFATLLDFVAESFNADNISEFESAGQNIKEWMLRTALHRYIAVRTKAIEKAKLQYITSLHGSHRDDYNCLFGSYILDIDDIKIATNTAVPNNPMGAFDNVNRSSNLNGGFLVHPEIGFIVRFPILDSDESSNELSNRFEDFPAAFTERDFEEEDELCLIKGGFNVENDNDIFTIYDLQNITSFNCYLVTESGEAELLGSVTADNWENYSNNLNSGVLLKISDMIPDLLIERVVSDGNVQYSIDYTSNTDTDYRFLRITSIGTGSNSYRILRDVPVANLCAYPLEIPDDQCFCEVIPELNSLYSIFQNEDVLNTDYDYALEIAEKSEFYSEQNGYLSSTQFALSYFILTQGTNLFTFKNADGDIEVRELDVVNISWFVRYCNSSIGDNYPDRMDNKLWPLELGCQDYETDCYNRNLELRKNLATAFYNNQFNQLVDEFRDNFTNGCLSSIQDAEVFEMTNEFCEYNYTLYYYDVVGNLIATVYPEGVRKLSSSSVDEVQDFRKLNKNNDATNTEKAVWLHTQSQHVQEQINKFEYNSLGEVINSESPDAGEVKYFYDNLGRLVASQNAVQKSSIDNSFKHYYSITTFDDLGRISEVGEYFVPNQYELTKDIAKGDDDITFKQWLEIGSFREVTKTWYDQPFGGENIAAEFAQQGTGAQVFNRNRITAVTYYQDGYDNHEKYTNAYIYRYNVHGLTTTHLQHNPELSTSQSADEFKTTNYDFDLFSGLVHQVAYQEGKEDQLLTKFDYDKSGRLKSTYTSVNGINWDEDAKNHYYLHGPKYRMEYGVDHQIQGVDVVSTLAGLKAVNSNTLNAQNDIGKDGVDLKGNDRLGLQANRNSNFARDVAGFVLKYYNEDYNSISGNNSTRSFEANDSYITNDITSEYKSLYSGQITASSTAIRNLSPNSSNNMRPEVLFNTYKYDNSYNLIEQVVYSSNQVTSNNSWTGATFNGPSKKQSDYYVGISYDLNKNITSLKRNAFGTSNEMDDFKYKYLSRAVVNDGNTATDKQLLNNRLYHVHDEVLSSAAEGDYEAIDEFTSNLTSDAELLLGPNTPAENITNSDDVGFIYNKLGQLIENKGDGLAISWNNSGKVKTITHNVPTKAGDNLEFIYDAFGRRQIKIVKERKPDGVNFIEEPKNEWEYVYYALDGNGMTQATYKHKFNHSQGTDVQIKPRAVVKVFNPTSLTDDGRPPTIEVLVNNQLLVLASTAVINGTEAERIDLAQRLANLVNTQVAGYSANLVPAVCSSCLEISSDQHTGENFDVEIIGNYVDEEQNSVAAGEVLLDLSQTLVNTEVLNATASQLTEHLLYADSRLGVWRHNKDLTGVIDAETALEEVLLEEFSSPDLNLWSNSAADISVENSTLKVVSVSQFQGANYQIPTTAGESVVVQFVISGIDENEQVAVESRNSLPYQDQVTNSLVLQGDGRYSMVIPAGNNAIGLKFKRCNDTQDGEQIFFINSLSVAKQVNCSSSKIGNKYFEFKNWLGSVISVFKDTKHKEVEAKPNLVLSSSFEGGDGEIFFTWNPYTSGFENTNENPNGTTGNNIVLSENKQWGPTYKVPVKAGDIISETSIYAKFKNPGGNQVGGTLKRCLIGDDGRVLYLDNMGTAAEWEGRTLQVNDAGWTLLNFESSKVVPEILYKKLSDNSYVEINTNESQVFAFVFPYVSIGHAETVFDDFNLTVTYSGEQEFYSPVIVQSTDYYPYGMAMPGRNWTSPTDEYRYGYQGSEVNTETYNNGNQYTTEFRQLDARFGRWFSTDPVFHAYQNPYNSMDGNPLFVVDEKGSNGTGAPRQVRGTNPSRPSPVTVYLRQWGAYMRTRTREALKNARTNPILNRGFSRPRGVVNPSGNSRYGVPRYDLIERSIRRLERIKRAQFQGGQSTNRPPQDPSLYLTSIYRLEDLIGQKGNLSGIIARLIGDLGNIARQRADDVNMIEQKKNYVYDIDTKEHILVSVEYNLVENEENRETINILNRMDQAYNKAMQARFLEILGVESMEELKQQQEAENYNPNDFLAIAMGEDIYLNAWNQAEMELGVKPSTQFYQQLEQNIESDDFDEIEVFKDDFGRVPTPPAVVTKNPN